MGNLWCVLVIGCNVNWLTLPTINFQAFEVKCNMRSSCGWCGNFHEAWTEAQETMVVLGMKRHLQVFNKSKHLLNNVYELPLSGCPWD